MNKCLFLILTFLSSLLFADESATKDYITSENDALSLVDGIVDMYNGKLVQKNLDVQILGSKPLEINRYYDSGHHFRSAIGYGFGLSVPLSLTFDESKDIKKVYFEQRMGFNISATVNKVSKKNERPRYQGVVDEKFFESGYTNCCEALLNGEPSLRALTIEGSTHNFIIKLGDGTTRHYVWFKSDYFIHDYRLVREDFSDGTHRHYTYKEKDKLLLKRIWTTNFNDTLTFNWADFYYKKKNSTITTSNGLFIWYQQNVQKGYIRKGPGALHSFIKDEESILEKVTSNY